MDMIVEDLFLIISLDLDMIRLDVELKCRVDFVGKKNGHLLLHHPPPSPPLLTHLPLFPNTQLL